MRRRNSPSFGAFAAFVLVPVTLSTALLPAVITSASAQEVIRRLPDRGWSLFDIFTPRRDRVQPVRRVPNAPRAKKVDQRAQPAKPRKPKTRVVAKKSVVPAAVGVAAGVAADVAIEAPVEKKPDARVVLVVGDFMASGLAEALQQTFAASANVRVLDRSQGSSGFVRQDVYDWPKQIGALIDADKAAAVVVMMGSNDRQPMRIDGSSEQPRSDAWNKEYQTRTIALAEALEARKLPFVWVSAPAFKSPKMSSDMLAFNTVYKGAAEGGGGEFVDVWDGFVDENGAFVMTGPDVNGQPVRLRGRDGINLTDAGKAKVAFYVEKPLRKLLGEPEEGAQPAIVAPALPAGPVAPVAIDRTDPIALDDPGLDGGLELLGAPASGAALPGDPLAAASAPAGRADSFGPASAEPVAARAPAPVEPADTALKQPPVVLPR